jgi:hypothetical protein
MLKIQNSGIITNPVWRLLTGLRGVCNMRFEVLEERDWKRKDDKMMSKVGVAVGGLGQFCEMSFNQF